MPVLSGFLPIPLAMMIPFMGAQSLVLGKQFGEGFQFGKRKISAMTNEEFNKITPQKLAQNNADELRQMIPSMKQSIQDMRDFQSFIVHELIATAKQLPDDIFKAAVSEGSLASNVIKGDTDAFVNQLIPQAFAEDAPDSNQKFASDYEKEAMAIPFKLLADIVQKMLSGKLLKPIERKIGYVNAYKKRLPKKSTTTAQEAIDNVATGLNKIIPTHILNMRTYLNNLRKLKEAGKHRTNSFNLNMKYFLNTAKTYNHIIQTNRQYSNTLVVDTRKSISAFRLIFKT